MKRDGLYRQIEAALRRQQWRVDRTEKGHVRATPPDPTRPVVITAGTTGDVRQVKNWISMLRRCGFVWPEREGMRR